MKTRTFLILCLLMGFAAIRLSAQSGKGEGNKTQVYDWPVPAMVVITEVICDGVTVDVLTNAEPFILKCVDHYKNGEWTSYNYHLNNVKFISTWTDEVFRFQGTERGSFIGGLDYTFGNMIGNKGSHYVMKLTINISDWSIVEVSSNCH